MTRFTDAMRAGGYGTDPAGDTARRRRMASAAVTPEEWRGLRDGASLPAPDPAADHDPVPVPGHALTRERTPAGNTVVRCECGRWDGGWTGPRSRRRVLDDYAAHVAAELAAAGPLRVVAERLDRPEEEL